MRTYLNETGVPLPAAVFLASNFYDYHPGTVSATTLLKPVRQVILQERVPQEQAMMEITNLVKSRMGTAIHDGFEKSWSDGNHMVAMKALGYTDKVIDRVVINPEGEPAPDAIPVYMEQRMFREIEGKKVSGKFDFIGDGHLMDVKATGTFTWVNGTKVEDYQMQGSIYRWLDAIQPVQKITQEFITILFFFWDWMEFQAKQNPNYPQRPIEQQQIPLLPLDETENFVVGKLRQYELHRRDEEPDLPECSDKELWRQPPQFKYYRDPNKRARSTKNFSNAREAHERLVADGGKGIVVEVPGEVVACKYCPAFPICTQKDRYIADGSLKLS